jgi:predicted naringenin-chalcone synthase
MAPDEGSPVTVAWLNRIGTATPVNDVHSACVEFGRTLLPDERSQALFMRMAALADIRHRYAIFAPGVARHDDWLDCEGFYRRGAFPSTAARMARFEPEARALAAKAIAELTLGPERRAITHLVVASCTGFAAPGLDFHIMSDAGLDPSVERTMVGFMGCFAAVNALKLARHIVRSEPAARVLVVNLELCSLHLQEQWQLEKMLTYLLFGDGASAALLSAVPAGLALGRFSAEVIPATEDLITWHIRDSGFEMHLSGRVPACIRRFLHEQGTRLLGGRAPDSIAHWAVHAGGRSILDAVQQGLALNPEALRQSRHVLREYGNMSSATLMFVLQRILYDRGIEGDGIALAFGPGLTVESFSFRRG